MQKRFNKISELPTEYRSVIVRAINSGLIDLDKEENLNITEDMLKIILMLGRLGLI